MGRPCSLLAIASSKPLFLVNALILSSLGYCLKQALIFGKCPHSHLSWLLPQASHYFGKCSHSHLSWLLPQASSNFGNALILRHA